MDENEAALLNNNGTRLADQGKFEEAIEQFQNSLEIQVLKNHY